MRRTVLGVVAALAVGLATLGLASCTPAKRILVIGDSLSVGAVQAGLGGTDPHTWVVNAEVGRGTNAGAAVARRATGTYDLVVIALGTNDYLDSEAAYRARIEAMMAALGPKVPVVWIDVDTHTDHLAPAASGVNPALRAAAAAHANLRLGRWDRYVDGLGDTARYRTGDQIHYSGAGYALRARWMEGLAAA